MKKPASIFFISLLLTSMLWGQAAFLPFDVTDAYAGKWNLSRDVPGYLAAYLRESEGAEALNAAATVSLFADSTTVQFDNYETLEAIREKTGARFVFTGKITVFDINRYTVAEPSVAGYENFTCNITAEIRIIELHGMSTVYSGSVPVTMTRNTLGINLLGKPSTDKEQYYGLDGIGFGSEEFTTTLPGETMLLFCKELLHDISASNPGLMRQIGKGKMRPEVTATYKDSMVVPLKIITGEFITYDAETGEGFVNLGSTAVQVNDRLAVYASGDTLRDPSTGEVLGTGESRMGYAEVAELRGEKLSLCIVREGKEAIRKGMKVRKRADR